MLEKRVIKNALISVFSKDGLEEVLKKLHSLNITLFSTGGTEIFIKKQGIPVNKVEDLTSYPSILGGRVKTLHPNIFGGILARRELRAAITTLACYVVMTITSYFLSKKHYSIPYDLKRLFLYLMLMLILYTLIFYTSFSIYINTLLLVGFLLVLIILQKHKKKINFQA